MTINQWWTFICGQLTGEKPIRVVVLGTYVKNNSSSKSLFRLSMSLLGWRNASIINMLIARNKFVCSRYHNRILKCNPTLQCEFIAV
jgi:hypothetical protein